MKFKNPYYKYALNLIIFSFTLLIIGVLLFSIFLTKFYLPVFPYIFIFFILMSFSVHSYLLLAIKNNTRKFIRYFMLTTILKFFGYIGFIVIYLLLARDNAINFLIFFFILYLLFTIFEINCLLKALKSLKTS